MFEVLIFSLYATDILEVKCMAVQAIGTTLITSAHKVLICGPRKYTNMFAAYRCEESDQSPCVVGENSRWDSAIRSDDTLYLFREPILCAYLYS
jgi:hypothetical protein